MRDPVQSPRRFTQPAVSALLLVAAVLFSGCQRVQPDVKAQSVKMQQAWVRATAENPHYSVTELAYADRSPAQKLDLYLPKNALAPCPVVIWIHGGGFSVGDKHSMPHKDSDGVPKNVGPRGPFQIQVPDVDALTGMGYAVVSLNYRLTESRNPWLARFIGPDLDSAALPALQDAKAAVRYLRANAGKYQLDASKFAVWGNSMGGYLAVMLGTTGDQMTPFDGQELGNAGTSSAVQAVVVWYGAEDRIMPPFGLTDYVAKAKALPPFLIANGDQDPIVSPERAMHLQETLSKAGAVSTLTIVPGAAHEDPAFMKTQMAPAFAFLNKVFSRVERVQ